MRLQYSPLGFGLIAVLFSCSESSYELSRSEDAAWADTGYYGAEAGDADADTDVDADEDSDGWEPEAEDDFLKLMPATTDAYVFVANPGRNTVTRISVPSLDVITAEVGDNPTSVSTTDDYTLAVTFNADSDDVSIIESETLEVTTVTVLDDLNTMKMSPTGDWVVAYHDVDSQEEDTTEGVVSYKQVSFVDLASGEHTPLVVGFKPEDIQFTDDGELALVVGDAYLALVDLTADELSVDLVQISEDLVNPDEAEEVVLVPDGSYAFVRQFGAEELVLVDLAAQAIDYLPVGSNPTDLDLTPDGTQAVVVARGSGELWVYDVADLFGSPEVITLPEDGTFGSVILSPDDTKGLLYSTATSESIYASWDRTDPDAETAITTHPLVKPVSQATISPTGGTALIFHPEENTDDSDPFYDDHFGISMIDLDSFLSNDYRLTGEPTAYADSDDGTHGFFVMEEEQYLQVLTYSSLILDEVELKSDPVHVGVLPDTAWAYVSQEHDLGRISFYDAETEDLNTITGFELNSGIEEY